MIADDVLYYNRLCGMLQAFKPTNANFSDGVLQVGTGCSDHRLVAGTPNALHTNGMTINGPEMEVIAASSDAEGTSSAR